uniref:Hydroxysteroid 17-beta dehydrogenase 4 n=1 Tax=Cardiosporidium cionae TaxID=476202 RepID=A0A3Q8UBF4_9APIC|nr:hydroxysteroid 17-beta dehydrogenase 4 [Cardiosporidium cionae]
MVALLHNRVAVVTGSGGGLGRAYAKVLASLGAKVVVNDIGAGLKGEAQEFDSTTRPADVVVQEIRSDNGIAVANYDSVEFGEKIIETAIANFGRIDILVNNAGILRDVTFLKMSQRDWDSVMDVHLRGTYLCTKAAWPRMQAQGYGRIINVSSAAGLYGNFGQANYSTAKASLIGFTKSLAVEGAKRSIHVNCIAPLAGTRMTETILQKDMADALKPEYISPIVAFLVSESCEENGEVFEIGAGWVAKLRWQRSEGYFFPLSFTSSDVKREWKKVTDFSAVTYPSSVQESMMLVLKRVLNSSHPDTAALIQNESGTSLLPDTKSTKIFRLMGAYLEKFPAEGKVLVARVQCIFNFEIKSRDTSNPSKFWTIDLKHNSGAVHEGKGSHADATFIITDTDFVDISLGKLNSQVAFLKGKLKAKGSMRAVTKFTRDLFPPISEDLLALDAEAAIYEYLKTLKGSSRQPNKQSEKDYPNKSKGKITGTDNLKSRPLMEHIMKHLETPAGKALVEKVNCIYRLDILPSKDSSPITFSLDLKSKPPKAYAGIPPSCDAHFTMLDDDFVAVMKGNLNPQSAFMQGKMKIKGSMAAAMKFKPSLFPQLSRL